MPSATVYAPEIERIDHRLLTGHRWRRGNGPHRAIGEEGSDVITIGIRADPKGLTFAVYDTDEARVVNVEAIRIPAAFGTPEGLKYLRSNLLDVLREYSVARAGVRVTEPNAKALSIERVQIEGVVQEAFASSTVEAYYVGQISSISARLGIDRTEFKPLVSGERDHAVERWREMSPHAREAILCAQGAVNV